MKMLQTTLLLLWIWTGGSYVVGQVIVESIRSPWANLTDPTWIVSRTPDRRNLTAYAVGLQPPLLGSPVYIDKLSMQNGSTMYAAIFTNEHVGIGAGFASLDMEPISMTRFTRRVQENPQRKMVPVSACAYEEIDGSIKFESMWMPSKTIDYQVQYDSDNQTMINFQNQGYYAVSVCSTKTRTSNIPTPSVVIIWQRLSQQPSAVRPEQRISVDIADSDCATANTRNQVDLFYPIAMQMFNKGTNQVRCSAIWQKMTAPSLKYEVRFSSASALSDAVNLADKQMKPRQISRYLSSQGLDQIMVLWTNYDTRNISFNGTIYAPTDNIPITWLPGSTTGMRAEDQAKFESTVTRVMRAAQIPALTFAVSKNDQLKRAVAFGYSNPLTKEVANVTTKFRLGSISKVLTSAAIFSLIDQGRIGLNSTIFGPGSILGTDYGTQPYSQNLLKVKLVNLLEHSSGGWGDGTTQDALFLYEGYNQSAFIGIEIDKYGPVFEPGTVYDYSNFGYYLLGVIITKITGEPYDQYVKEKFWRPAGVSDDRVGIENRWFTERQPNEAVFFPDALLSLMDSYDLIDPDRVASAGGWIASPMDWLRVTRLFNGFICVKDNLTMNSFTEMTRPSNASGGFNARDVAIGNDFFGYMHDGYYPGGMANYQRRNNGIELMYMHNKGPDTTDILNAIQILSRLFVDLTPNWPQQDLFSA